jgi:hypothetical protein
VDKSFVRCGDAEIETLSLTVPNIGPWTAEVDFVEAPALSGQVTVQVGPTQWVGTIIPTEDGTFGLRRRCMIVGGAGAWGKILPPKHYHNDAQVRALLLAQDAARETGETLGDFLPAQERLGIDYVRAQNTAAQTLLDAAGGNPWWVDPQGLTQVGLRPTRDLDSSQYEVLAFNPHTRRGTLSLSGDPEDVSVLGIGTILTERLDTPQTIREYTTKVDGEGLRIHWWSGAEFDTGMSDLAQQLRAFVDARVQRLLLGKYQYRCIRMVAGRVDVQIVRKQQGLPDQQTISMWPGVAGAVAKLQPGTLCYVEFEAGDRTRPIITGFDPAAPVELAFSSAIANKVTSVAGTLPAPQTITLAGTGAGAGTYTFSFSPTLLPNGTLANALVGSIIAGKVSP